MRTTNNAVLKPWAHSSSGPLNSQKTSTASSSISDTSAKFQQEAASQSMADSVQQRAQDDPAAFREALQQAFAGKASPAALDALMAKALSGNLPLPANVQFVDAGTLGPNAMGAYDSTNGGTIYLDSRLLNDSQALEAVYTEELGHHLDAELGGQDAAGDEGAIFSDSLLKGKLSDSELRALKSENDSGFINVDNKRIAVEFNGYSGPGSSEATGGSSSSSSSSSGESSSGSSSGSSSSGGSSSGGSSGSSSSGGSSSGGSSSSSSSGGSSSGGSSGSSSSGGSSSSSSRSSSSSGNSSSYSGPGSSSGTGGSDNSSSSYNPTSYSGPGSSSGTGGSDDAYSPTSYSGPGSTFETGGSDNFSAATPGSAHSYFSPGSRIGIDAIAPTPPPEDEDKDDGSSVAYSKTHDLLERETPTGGTTQAARADYVYNPLSSRFERQHDSNQFAQNENTMRFNGGTSDEFRYNNSESQARPSGNIQFGDSFSTGGFNKPDPDFERGDDQLGISGEVNMGLSNTFTAGYALDRDGLEATVGYEGFYGVQGEAEVHGEYGIISGKASTEGQAGVLGSADAGITIDPRNGFTGQAGVEFFAGAQLNLDVETELGESVDLAAGLDLKAGVGFEATAEIEFNRENIGMDLEIGGAWGVGADVNIDASISPIGISNDITEIYHAVSDFFKK